MEQIQQISLKREMMIPDHTISGVLIPFVQRGLFDSLEHAVAEMAQNYTLHQIERYKSTVDSFQAKYGMNYGQFESYLKSRSECLSVAPNPKLSRAIMSEEDDAFDWKVALEMLSSWLGIQAEIRA